MIDLQILRQHVELGASPGRIIELVEQMLADPSVTAPSHKDDERLSRKREKTRLRVRRWRERKASASLPLALPSVTNSVTNSVTERHSVTVTLPKTSHSVTETVCSEKTETCKDAEFPDLSERFKLPVTLSERHRDAVGNAQSTKSIPCQNTLFPLVELSKEERKKERTKERKKEERDRVLVVVRKEESKNLSARAREATASQGKAGLRRARVPIPDNWFSAAAMAFALANGLTAPIARFEAERFADHARANGRLCAGETGWLAAWRNWIRSPYRRNSGAPPVEPFDVRRHIV